MLIGIMRRSVGERALSFTGEYEYEFKTLLRCDTLIRTEERSTLETILRELIIFKEKCDDHEPASVSIIGISYIFY
jgi:hypothetical protein